MLDFVEQGAHIRDDPPDCVRVLVRGGLESAAVGDTMKDPEKLRGFGRERLDRISRLRRLGGAREVGTDLIRGFGRVKVVCRENADGAVEYGGGDRYSFGLGDGAVRRGRRRPGRGGRPGGAVHGSAAR